MLIDVATDRQIRVLLAEKNSLVKAGICSTLNAETDLILVGETTNIYEAQQLSQKLKPDILLLSNSLSGSKLPEIMAYLYEHCSDVKVVILSGFDNLYKQDLLASGAMGCLLKDEDTTTLVRAIRTIAKGHTWFSQTTLEKIVQQEINNSTKSSQLNLTAREKTLLGLIVRGWNNARIATELCLAQQTVRNYTSRIYSKLSVNSRSEAIVWLRNNKVC